MFWFKKEIQVPVEKCSVCGEELDDRGHCYECMSIISWEKERERDRIESVRQERLDSLIERVPELIALLSK